MNAALLPITGSDPITLLSSKASGAWNALETRYASQVTQDELDHLFALFVLGLTSPFYAEERPLAHLDACRTLMSQKLDDDRVERALRSVPTATQGWSKRPICRLNSWAPKTGKPCSNSSRNPIKKLMQSS